MIDGQEISLQASLLNQALIVIINRYYYIYIVRGIHSGIHAGSKRELESPPSIFRAGRKLRFTSAVHVMPHVYEKGV